MSKELLDEWQTRLGLHDWRIKLNDNCKPDDMPVEESDGATEWTECNKTARIDILDPQYYGERIIPFDYERILVHELLHLKTCLISDLVPDLQARYMHQMIDDLARALVDAKRSKDEPQTCSFSDCDNFKNPDYERCIECKRKQIKLKTEQTERSE